MIRTVLLLLMFLMCCGVAQADTYNAVNCSSVAVTDAIALASSGDTVTVPAGGCTWSSQISIPDGVILQGAGIDSTIITRTPAGSTIYFGTGSRVTGFTFNKGWITTGKNGWRVDHCKFSQTSFVNGIYIRGTVAGQHPSGLVDNCIFENSRPVILGAMAQLYEGDQQHQLWAQSINLGTDDAVYVEDCVFNFTVFGNAIDGNCGGAYVFRFNTVNGTYVELHSVQGDNRAFRRWEIYENILDSTSKVIYYPYRIRAGAGVIFNSTLVGDQFSNYKIGLDNVRSYGARGSGRMCTGGSLWDGNEMLINGSHSGGDGETNLSDSSKAWETNELLRIIMTGNHTGNDNAGNLTTTSYLDAGDRIEQLLHNLNDCSYCEITENTDYTANCTLTGGAENDWDTDDSFKITGGYWVYNLISGAKCQIVSNSANTAVCTLVGGDRQTWNTGDTYKITNGYPCRDQIGRGPDNPQWDNDPATAYTQPNIPVYGWGNRRQSNDAVVPFKVINSGENHIQADRDYYDENLTFDGTTGVGVGLYADMPATCTPGVAYWANDTGEWNTNTSGNDGQLYKCTSADTWELYYTPYTYPHPLREVDGTPDPTNLDHTNGTTWINHTWSAGSGNVTDSYNVSVNLTWYNTTTNTYYNHTGLSASSWSNITVWGWNSTYSELSSGSVSENVQIDTGFSPDHTKAYYNTTSQIINTVNSTGYVIYNRTVTLDDNTASSFNLVVKIT